jgi:hypothetical protein
MLKIGGSRMIKLQALSSSQLLPLEELLISMSCKERPLMELFKTTSHSSEILFWYLSGHLDGINADGDTKPLMSSKK